MAKRTNEVLAKAVARGGYGWYVQDIGDGQYVLVGDTMQKSNRGGSSTVASEIADEILADLGRDTDLFGICDANTDRLAVWVGHKVGTSVACWVGEWQVFESNRIDYRAYKTWTGAERRLAQR